jgi:uncharacterized protein YcbX
MTTSLVRFAAAASCEDHGVSTHRTILGTVGELHRYPVKSLTGERLEQVDVEDRGVVGDRLWSVRDPDGKLGSGKSTRRFRRMDGLLALRAAYDGDVPVLTFPDGRSLRGDDPEVHQALSDHVGRPVSLGREVEVSHFDEGPIHLVTTSSLATIGDARGDRVDPRRLRPNVVVDTAPQTGLPENDWSGRRLQIGEVVLQVLYAMPRCVMLDLATADLSPDHGVLRTVTAVNAGDLGVVADVVAPGTLALGDPVSFLP